MRHETEGHRGSRSAFDGEAAIWVVRENHGSSLGAVQCARMLPMDTRTEADLECP
jgi:hypothetical protein